MSVARCQEEVSSREFVRWKVFLTEEHNYFHRVDRYLAQIAHEIRRAFIKDYDGTLENCLLEFKPAKSKKEEKAAGPDKEKIAKSQQAWFAASGTKLVDGVLVKSNQRGNSAAMKILIEKNKRANQSRRRRSK